MPPEHPTPTATKTYHSHFDDPRDDLELCSQDGIHFRVSSHKLARARYDARTCNVPELTSGSTVFRDMLSLTDHGATENLPIKFEAPQSVLVDFLDTVSVSRVEQHLSCLEFDRTIALARFTHIYGGDALHEKVIAQLLRVGVGTAAFELLVYASERDDWALATKALRNVGGGIYVPHYFGNMPAKLEEYLDRLTPDMQLALLKALACKSGSLYIPSNWSDIHKGFVKPTVEGGRKRSK